MHEITGVPLFVPYIFKKIGECPWFLLVSFHVTPEALCGGLLAKVRDGELIRLDVGAGILELLVDAAELAGREYAEAELGEQRYGVGRQIFAALRSDMLGAEEGASSLFTMFGRSVR